MTIHDKWIASRTPDPAASLPELYQLVIFLNVVETRSFTRTAHMLGRTQPAISQAIARLEDTFGGDLFERRRGAPLYLTPVGEAILPSARTILGAIDQQRVDAIESAQGRKGRLTLGLFTGLSAGPLRAGIAEFLAASAKVTLQIVEAHPRDLHRKLVERTIDCMVGVSPDADLGNGLAIDTLWEERLVIAVPADHQLSNLETIQWNDIWAFPLLGRVSGGEQVDHRHLLGPEIAKGRTVEWHDVSQTTLLDMVGMGMGATLIVGSFLVPHQNVAFRFIRGNQVAAPVVAIWSRDDRNPLRHRLLRIIRAHAHETRSPLTLPYPATGL